MAGPTAQSEGPGKFEITASDGTVYHIENATPEMANTLANHIEERIKSGDPQLRGTPLPYNAQVEYPQDMVLENDNSIQPGAINTFLNRAVSAAPFNFGDEIAAAGNAAIPGMAWFENFMNKDVGLNPTAPEQTSMWSDGSTGFWDAFGKNQKSYQNQLNVGSELNPGSDAAGNLVGAIAGAKGAGAATRGVGNVATRVAPTLSSGVSNAYQAAATAAPVRTGIVAATVPSIPAGYVAGYGAGDTPENRERGGGQGAVAGAVLGPTLGYVGVKAAPAVRNMWNAIRGRGTEEEALQQIVTRLADDGYDVTSPAGVANLKSTLSSIVGRDVTIADVGRATRGRTQQAIEQAGPGQQAALDIVGNRQAGATDRLVGDIQQNMVPPNLSNNGQPLNVYSRAEDMIAARANNAEELKPPAMFERQVVPPSNIPTYEPPVPPPPAAVYDEPVGVVGQPELNLQPPAPVRTVRETPTAGLERITGSQVPRPAPATTEAPDAGLFRALGGPPAKAGPQPLDADFVAAMQAPEQAAAAAEAQAAAAASAARKARLEELRGMSAERRAEAIAADRKQAEEVAFFENAQQTELPLSNENVRRRGVDSFNIPAPTINERAPRMVTDDVVNRLVAEHPLMQKALTAAVQKSQSERAGNLILGRDTTSTPEILAGQPLDYRTADYVKRFLDQEVNLAYRNQSQTFSAAQAKELEDLRNVLRDRLRAGNKEYDTYLSNYADESELIRSLEEGQTFNTLAPEQIAAAQEARPQAAVEMYQLGAGRNLADTVQSTTDKGFAGDRILNTDRKRAQLEALGLKPENAEALTRAVGQEQQLNLLPKGINPKAIPADKADILGAAGKVYNPYSPVSWVRAAAAPIVENIKLLRSEKINEALLKKVLEVDPAVQEDIIQQLVVAGQQKKADNLRRVLRARNQGATAGLLIGSPVSLQEE